MKRSRRRKLTITLISIVAVILIWNHLPYYYNNDKTADYSTKNAAPHSRVMCAGYVIRAMWNGGCPIGLVPAYAYNKVLPQMGFKEISLHLLVPMYSIISAVVISYWKYPNRLSTPVDRPADSSQQSC